MQTVPDVRIRPLNHRDVDASGEFVLYWMTSYRRVHSNFSLQRAVEWAHQLNKPLVIFEALRINYRWASDRHHRFVLQGMAQQRRNLQDSSVTYYSYVEPEANHGHGLLEALTARACVVVTDDFPCFFIPTMLKLVSRRIEVKLEAVDSNGIFPMYATDQIFSRAHSFRRFLQKQLRPHLQTFPKQHALQGIELPQPIDLPDEILARWPAAEDELLTGTPEVLAPLDIDHSVKPAAFDGGEEVAAAHLKSFLSDGFVRYADDRNHPDTDASSGLSPYLHFGHIAAHTIFEAIAERENWSIDDLAAKVNGSRDGWWGMSAPAESFLDELITWREIGFNMCAHHPRYDRYDSLPDWARKTIAEHAQDERPYVYSLEEFERAETHDEIWNAAQRQLVRDGRMHNYLRMLWGKKIYEWSANVHDALRVMIELNNKYAVDGRDPNSYSGIFWVLGRYDRAWGPEREIFGKLRYMTSDSTQRKLKMKGYLKTYSKRENSLF